MSADNTGSGGPEQSVPVDIVPAQTVPQNAGVDGAAAQNGKDMEQNENCSVYIL